MFKFQPHFCNGFYDILIMSVNLINIAILSINGAEYHYTINGVSKSYALNLLENVGLAKIKEFYENEKL